MSETKWTLDQQRVIDTRNKNILVSASAGSGKTAVLVERIISLITDPSSDVDVDEMLVVTFTRAAAAEMKERILNALIAILEKDPGNERVARQMVLIHSASISTIDSFCLEVIRNHYNEIDLDPSFRAGDEGEMKLLKEQVLSQILEEGYSRLMGNEEPWFMEPSEFEYLVKRVETGKRSGRLSELVIRLFNYSNSYAEPLYWLAECRKMYDDTANKTPRESEEIWENGSQWAVCEELPEDRKGISGYGIDENSEICQAIREHIINSVLSLSDREEALADFAADSEGPEKYPEFFQREAEVLRRVADTLKETGLFDMGPVLKSVVFEKLVSAGKKGSFNEATKERLKALRDSIKGDYQSLIKNYFYADGDKLIEDIRVSGRTIRGLIDITLEFSGRFDSIKRKNNVVDFSDMEHLAYSILTCRENGITVPGPVAKEYMKKYKTVMIDEYQDSNFLQEAILSAVSGDPINVPNRFIVGDVKQSIYGFRLSRPELFIEKASAYELSENAVRIDLQQNFRSREIVLDSVNAIMRQIMTEEVGGINYDESHMLRPGVDRTVNKRPISEVLIMKSQSGTLTEDTAREKEAAMVADRILKMMEEEEVYDRRNRVMRPLRFGDIAILSRAAAGRMEIYKKALMDRGIPAYTESRSGYFDAMEVKCVLDYLRILDNPLQDVPMASVLRSPMGGFSSEELSALKLCMGNVGFAQGILSLVGKAGETVGDSQSEDKYSYLLHRLIRWYDRVREHRKMISYLPLQEIISGIISDTGFDLYLAALPEGRKRLANIDVLIQKAGSFAQTSFKGVFNFLNYLDRLRDQEIDFGEANVCDESSDVVRIMTIHKSKGLEFPVVFVVDLASSLGGGRGDMMEINGRFKLAMTAVDPVNRTKKEPVFKKFIKEQNALSELGEELRILYVAMTRAQDKLILTANVKDQEKAMEKWQNVTLRNGSLSIESLVSCSTRMDILMRAILNCEEYFDIKWMEPSDILTSEVKRAGESLITEQVLKNIDTSLVYDQRLKERMDEERAYIYPYADSDKGPVKISVSDIKMEHIRENSQTGPDGGELFGSEESIPLIPAFIREEAAGAHSPASGVNPGALRGTAYHRFLELWDYCGAYKCSDGSDSDEVMDNCKDKTGIAPSYMSSYPVITEELVQNGIRDMVARGTMDGESASMIKASHMVTFLNSSLGRRMAEAAHKGKLRREQIFMKGVGEDELHLVQGIIDAYFEENGELVLLDYKTDRVGTPKELVLKYQAQLDEYEEALVRLTGIKVKEKLIYSFSLGKQVNL